MNENNELGDKSSIGTEPGQPANIGLDVGGGEVNIDLFEVEEGVVAVNIDLTEGKKRVGRPKGVKNRPKDYENIEGKNAPEKYQTISTPVKKRAPKKEHKIRIPIDAETVSAVALNASNAVGKLIDSDAKPLIPDDIAVAIFADAFDELGNFTIPSRYAAMMVVADRIGSAGVARAAKRRWVGRAWEWVMIKFGRGKK